MPSSIGRRGFVGTAAAAAMVARAPALAAAAALPHPPFRFLFVTDAHVQPELDAAGGTARCFETARLLGGDFAIQGGDHVFDALGVGWPRANDLMALYDRVEPALGMTVHHAIGNHDCFGIYTRSGALPTDPHYGKKFFADRFGRLHYSFDHKNVHFVVLDPIGITADRAYEGRIDPDQLAWLARDLAALPAGMPIVVVSHIPLVTAFNSYVDPASAPPGARLHCQDRVANAWEVLPLFQGRNVLGVLQGHTHINETVSWRGIPFMTCGAVSGNWWHGTRLGTPEGFTEVRVENNRLHTRYHTYGFRSVDPHDT